MTHPDNQRQPTGVGKKRQPSPPVRGHLCAWSPLQQVPRYLPRWSPWCEKPTQKKTHTSPWLETTLILDNPWFCAVLSLPIPKKNWTNRVSILKIGIGINNLEPSSPAQFHSGKHHSGICLKSWWLIANIAEACDPDTQNLASIWFSQSVASFTKQSAKLHPMLRQNLSIAIWAL